MDDEFTKILLNTDAHSTLYVERLVTMVTILVDHMTNIYRLQDEKKVYELICAVQKYLETREGDDRDTNLCRIYIRRIEHLYYKVSSMFDTEIVAQSLLVLMVMMYV